jgi:hypothetical protein
MQPVKDSDQSLLRENNIMSENEVAYIEGDLLVIVNVVTEDKRVLGQASSFLTESHNRRILRG